jgi:hypothetical protein
MIDDGLPLLFGLILHKLRFSQRLLLLAQPAYL